MNHTLKRIISFAFVLILVMSFATPAFAAGTVTPLKGTVTVSPDYFYSDEYETSGWLTVQLAAGTRSFSMKRSDVKLSNNTIGAELTGFYKDYNKTTNKYQYVYGKKIKTQTTKFADYNYTIEMRIAKPVGTVTISYKIGSKAYNVKLNVKDYVSPVKKVTLTGVNGGKNLVSKTSDVVDGLKLASNVKSAKLSVTPAKGWTIRSINITDKNTGLQRSLGQNQMSVINGTVKNFSGLTSASLNWGKMVASDTYIIFVRCFNKSTGVYKTCAFYIN